MSRVLVIGGGPAGMMAAITAAENGNEVTILEKMPSFGKKLLITGKGRCNITSSLYMSEFIKNTPGNGKFLYSAFQNYTNADIIEFLKKQGLEVKEERGNRIFPVTDKSIDVLNCFKKRIDELKIKYKLETRVEKILIKNNEVLGVRTNREIIQTDKIILATGGKSYPLTGSTGDGYKIARDLGHTIIPIKPALVPLEVYEKEECKKIQGLSLKNIAIKIIDTDRKKTIYEDFGEMVFTHFGISGPTRISGPTILSGSAHLAKYKDIDYLLKKRYIKITIDLKPALTEEHLDDRILRDFKEFKNKQFKNSLDKLLPQKMIPLIVELSGINPDKMVNEITKEERRHLVQLIKYFTITIKNFRPVEEAIITCGGISTKEINPKTMESKLIKGLYFAGEIIDVDAYTGGFNLQIAYSTGYTAGINV
ncbi:MAG: FAD-dependent oxidoreductase [Clostridium sp. 28_12]|nr:MAG: FAD-dependent oxidoreductase [Clostridium sp. 28_12]